MTGETVIDGRTVRQKAHLLVRLDAPVCPASFADEIKKAMAKFGEIESDYLGLTTKPVVSIIETSPEYNAGTKAIAEKNYKLALASLKPLADKGHARRAIESGLHVRKRSRGRDRSSRRRCAGIGWRPNKATPTARRAWVICSRKAWAYRETTGSPHNGTPSRPRPETNQGQSWLASMYRDGRGVARDYKEAEKWFSLAAEQGSAWA